VDLKAQTEKVPLSIAPSLPKNKVAVVLEKCSATSQPPLTNTKITALCRKKEQQEIYERVVAQCRRKEKQKEQEAWFKEICSKKPPLAPVAKPACTPRVPVSNEVRLKALSRTTIKEKSLFNECPKGIVLRRANEHPKDIVLQGATPSTKSRQSPPSFPSLFEFLLLLDPKTNIVMTSLPPSTTTTTTARDCTSRTTIPSPTIQFTRVDND
jgi:hypothetical protein